MSAVQWALPLAAILVANPVRAQETTAQETVATDVTAQSAPSQMEETTAASSTETSEPGPAETSGDHAAPPAETTTVQSAGPVSEPVVAPAEPALAAEAEPVIPVAEVKAAPESLQTQEDGEHVPTRLDDVMVTSTKREKSLRDIPQSISSFNGEELETQGKMSLADYLEHSPGVVMNTVTPGLLRITIRGIGVETNPLSGQPSPTGIFINDTAFSDPYINGVQPDLSAFDLSSVELLKGPQGTLFGGAALSGAVRYVLQEPVFGEWQVKGFTQYVAPEEGTAAKTSGVTVNAPLYKDKLAVRLGYVTRKYPGVMDIVREPRQDDVDHGEGEQLRGLLTWQPFDELTLKLVHLEQDFSTPYAAVTSYDREHRENDKLVLDQPVTNDFSLDTFGLEYQFETMKFVSLTSLAEKNLDVYGDGTASLIGKPPEGYPEAAAAFLSFIDNSESKAQEFRLQSTDDSNFQWLMGAYLYNYKVFFDLRIGLVSQEELASPGSLLAQILETLSLPADTLYDETGLFYAVTNTRATERALFFDLSYKFWEDLEISAGARLYETEVKGGFRGVGLLTRAQNGGPAIDYSNNSIKENGINPKFAALYHATENLAFYAQAARGFRFGGLQSVPSTPGNDVPRAYSSDVLWNYEIGTRTNWLDNTLRLDLTAFFLDYKNPQITQSTTGLFSLSYTDNVAGAISRGLEFSARWLTPLSGLTLGLDAGVTDAHTTEEFETSDGTVVPAGTQMPGSAKTSYSGSIAYLRPVGVVLVGATVDYAYVGKGYSKLIEAPENAINDFGTLNVGLTFASEAWALRPMLALNVANVLDETGAKSASMSDALYGVRPYNSYFLNQPRTYTARLSLSF